MYNARLARMSATLLLAPALLIWVLLTLNIGLNSAMVAIAGIVWLLISVPVAILAAIDWFRSPSESGALSKTLRHLLRAPVFILGAIAFVIGASVLLWVVHNVLWERHPDFHMSGSLGLMFAMIAFGLYLMRLSLSELSSKRGGPQ